MFTDNEIREWFKDHVATLADHGPVQILEWGRPNSSTYYCRYVFDGHRMYITGDIGEAVFCFSSKIDINAFAETTIHYFRKKLEAYSEDLWDFDSDKGVKLLRAWLRELKSNGTKWDHDEMKDFFEKLRGCNNESEWAGVINDADFLSALEPNYWEWMYHIGREMPPRIRAYLIGLQMASAQLNALKAVASDG